MYKLINNDTKPTSIKTLHFNTILRHVVSNKTIYLVVFAFVTEKMDFAVVIRSLLTAKAQTGVTTDELNSKRLYLCLQNINVDAICIQNVKNT